MYGELSIIAGLSDFLFMVKKTSFMHLMPPFPIGRSQEVGDAEIQARTTGCCDVLAEDDEDCLRKCRQLLSYLPANNKEDPLSSILETIRIVGQKNSWKSFPSIAESLIACIS